MTATFRLRRFRLLGYIQVGPPMVLFEEASGVKAVEEWSGASQEPSKAETSLGALD